MRLDNLSFCNYSVWIISDSVIFRQLAYTKLSFRCVWTDHTWMGKERRSYGQSADMPCIKKWYDTLFYIPLRWASELFLSVLFITYSNDSSTLTNIWVNLISFMTSMGNFPQLGYSTIYLMQPVRMNFCQDQDNR